MSDINTGLEALNREIITCRKCPRLVFWREEVARQKRKAYKFWDYWGRPVPGFGDNRAQVMVVGLAPGAHGSNRTGRQFTGDGSGGFLFPALYRAGFASQPNAFARDDGLILYNMYITAACRCAPPVNKPARAELDNCQPYLEREINLLKPKVIVCLGHMAFDRVLKIIDRGRSSIRRPSTRVKFSHGALFTFPRDAENPNYWLLCSYHPSRQNTNTGKLTPRMFDQIWAKAQELLLDA